MYQMSNICVDLVGETQPPSVCRTLTLLLVILGYSVRGFSVRHGAYAAISFLLSMNKFGRPVLFLMIIFSGARS